MGENIEDSCCTFLNFLKDYLSTLSFLIVNVYLHGEEVGTVDDSEMWVDHLLIIVKKDERLTQLAASSSFYRMSSAAIVVPACMTSGGGSRLIFWNQDDYAMIAVSVW